METARHNIALLRQLSWVCLTNLPPATFRQIIALALVLSDVPQERTLNCVLPPSLRNEALEQLYKANSFFL